MHVVQREFNKSFLKKTACLVKSEDCKVYMCGWKTSFMFPFLSAVLVQTTAEEYHWKLQRHGISGAWDIAHIGTRFFTFPRRALEHKTERVHLIMPLWLHFLGKQNCSCPALLLHASTASPSSIKILVRSSNRRQCMLLQSCFHSHGSPRSKGAHPMIIATKSFMDPKHKTENPRMKWTRLCQSSCHWRTNQIVWKLQEKEELFDDISKTS